MSATPAGHTMSVSVLTLHHRWRAAFVCPACDVRGSVASTDEVAVRRFAAVVAATHLADTEAPDAA